MSNLDPFTKPQQVSLRYSIPNKYLDRSTEYSKSMAITRLEKQLAIVLTNEMFRERKEYDHTVFELNGYFVTPQVLQRLVDERVSQARGTYPIVDFY